MTPHPALTRRHILKTMAAASGGILAASVGCSGGSTPSSTTTTPAWPPALPVGTFSPTADDTAFLDALEQQGSLYFWEQASPTTGQVLDHAATNLAGQIDPTTTESSIAATGFGLTALCIADQRGYLPNVTHADIVARVQTTLNFHLNSMPNQNGFFYHFNDVNTGQPLPAVEVSCIDTAWLLCGVLTARAYFNDPTITSLATQLYERINWPWFLHGGSTFAMAWYPSTDANPGFTSYRYDTFSELMALYLLAMASPTHPIPASSWAAFSRPLLTYEGYTYISSNTDPLFTQQWSQAWFDFRNKTDAYANYFTNSIAATQAHETFCLSYPQWYTEDYWGITASMSANGYVAWGGPPAQGPIDGSVVPCAAAGSLPFLPNQCLTVLESLKSTYPQSWGRYGFCDAFHPAANWYQPTSLGIDLGISVLMAENLRTSLIWDTFALNSEVPAALSLAGFHTD